MPQKEFIMERQALTNQPLTLPAELTIRDALQRVLRLPAVASKRYLTNKVDRSVTGLVAQQQCVGPLHTPLADVAVVALSPFSLEGSATAIGEQPVKGLVCPAAGARMAVGEALTNLVFARVTALKCSGNWMWAAKLPGEGACLWDACKAMCEVMGQLGVAIDGGKDSLSMAARVGTETVKAPGVLLWVPVSPGCHRLGGSALAQCYSQLGDSSPDLDQPEFLSACFNTTQKLIEVMELLFSEELGLVLEVSQTDLETVCQRYRDGGLQCHHIGRTCGFGPDAMVRYLHLQHLGQNVPRPFFLHAGRFSSPVVVQVRVRVDGQEVLYESLPDLRAVWEATSFQLERLQADELCVKQEEEGLSKRTQPYFKLTFDPSETPSIHQPSKTDVTGIFADCTVPCKRWAATVTYNPKAKAEFDRFQRREDTVSLGVCNGCQLLALLGWVGEGEDGADSEVVLTHNRSTRFESRFAQDLITSSGLAPLRYLDDQGCPTEEYPLNPNGSPQGIAGLCSRDGRHLAMMPHPERCTLSWQWPWAPRDLRPSLTPSPWLRMFRNAAAWCSNTD
ncbi:hypothetical protein GOODEAATRI_014168 [Goodea atripinnis]|uniref:FGAR-AT PurM N-terminal-like domain-containing protein n=1 Tax=Goodea atripinnis TaxID=208336 RepID=A0ABV0NL75_9TELE